TLAPDVPAIEVTAPDILDDDGEIAERFSGYGDNVSPALSWTAGPEGTASYVVIVEDPLPNFVVLHWLVYNIPASVTSLPEGIPAGPTIPGIEGAVQAANIAGAVSYLGPRPPDGTHTYH